MEKVIYGLWSDSATTASAFRRRLVVDLARDLKAAGAIRLRINLADEAAERGARHRRSGPDAAPEVLVQFWQESAMASRRAPFEAQLRPVSPRLVGWVVTESCPLPRQPDKEGRAEGWSQLAFLTRPARLAREAWLSAWLDRHSDVAMETQATCEYVQNLIVRPLTEEVPPYEAIVEEAFADGALCDPFVYFDAGADKARLHANIERLLASCDTFLDRDGVDVRPTGQYNYP